MRRIILIVSMFLILIPTSGCSFMKDVEQFLTGVEDASVTMEDGTVVGGGCKADSDGGTVCKVRDGKGKVWQIKYNSKGEKTSKTELPE